MSDDSPQGLYRMVGPAVRVAGFLIAMASLYWMWTMPLEFGQIPIGPIALGGVGFFMMDYELALYLLGRRGWPNAE